MRSDGTKKSPVRMLVYLLLLAAVVALGYFTDIVDFTELKAVFSLKLTALLKLAVMVLLVLLVSNWSSSFCTVSSPAPTAAGLCCRC